MSQASGGDPLSSLAEIDAADCAYKNALEEIVGVVGMSGPAGFPRPEYDVFTFSFAAWRNVGGEMRKQELYVQRKTPKDTPAKTEFAKFPEGSIHRLQVLLSEDETRSVLAEVLEKDVVDTDLEEFYQELLRPVVVDTKLFGPLTLNRRINWFEGKTSWCGVEVDLHVHLDVDEDLSTLLKTAESLFAAAKDWEARIKAYAVAELLALADDWRQEDDAPISDADFLRRMKLDTISISFGQEFEFWYDDDEMFAGHSIVVRGNLTEGLFECSIAG